MTLAVLLEKFGGPLVGFGMTLFLFQFHPDFDKNIETIRNIPTLTTCIFGFMLTLFGLIIQGNGEIIVKMKNNSLIFKRFLSFTKRIIFLALGISVFAFMIGAINPSWYYVQFEDLRAIEIMIKEFIFMFLVSCCLWLVLDLIYFIHLFFLLIRTEK